MRLEGRVALITGAGRNIVRATAIAIAREGGQVILNTRKSQKNIEAVAEEIGIQGGKALPILADVSDGEAVKKMVRRAEREFGKVDILINNAVQRFDCPFLDMTYEQWDQTMRSHLGGLFNCVKEVLPGMMSRKWGRIISFSGISASVGLGGRTAISTIKAGVIGFTKSLAREVGTNGITVNAVSPGDIEVICDPDYGGGQKWRNFPKTVELTALKRAGTPEEVASLCVYLCTNDAGYITGQNIGVNGGAC